jgi:formylglycine-generating enzyme required for sulfatase activity
MNFVKLSIKLFIVLILSNLAFGQKVSKKFKAFYNEFSLVEPMRVSFNPYRIQNYTANDTAILKGNNCKIQNVEINTPYLIGKKEITNIQYRQFVDWVKDSLFREELYANGYKEFGFPTANADDFGRSYCLNWETKIDWKDEQVVKILDKFFIPQDERFYQQKVYNSSSLKYNYLSPSNSKIQIVIYPDTLCWTKMYTSLSIDDGTGLSGNYFWHPAYNNYPVVGVTWDQCQAFCHFYSKFLNNYLHYINSDFRNNEVRLPYENEWLAVADSAEFNGYSTHFVSSKDKDGYNIIFGKIIDQNGFYIPKSNGNYFGTASVNKVSPNKSGLYHLHGNVAEWMMDTFDNGNCNQEYVKFLYFDENSRQPSNTFIAFNKKLEVDSSTIPMSMRDDYLYMYDLLPENIEDLLEIEDDAQLTLDSLANEATQMWINIDEDIQLNKNLYKAHIVKGGSWNDPLVYLLPQSSVLKSAHTADASTGFRVVIPLSQEQVTYLQALRLK